MTTFKLFLMNLTFGQPLNILFVWALSFFSNFIKLTFNQRLNVNHEIIVLYTHIYMWRLNIVFV